MREPDYDRYLAYCEDQENDMAEAEERERQEEMDQRNMEKEEMREMCSIAVSSPGKFEAEPIYVPYLWNASLEDGTPVEDGVVSVSIIEEDRFFFPELDHISEVTMYEDESGFVSVMCETPL
jgi:hypothetical protein